MENLVDKALKEMISNALLELEDIANSDVLCYSGPIIDGNENIFLDIIEELADSPDKRNCLMVVLTTTGGSAMAVERYVNIIRKHYEKVSFVVPDYAYSAGTIFCMSGDEIWMDYFSVLGPIDPQVKNKEGKFVPALGYLDKVNSLIDKSKNGTLTNAEFLILKDFDLAELRAYEQAKELTITLLKKWLVKYKFKEWNKHANGNPVTIQEKEKRAEEIADKLGDNNIWKSHGRPICIEELENLKLKIEDYSNKKEIRKVIRKYYNLSKDMINKYGLNIFIQTRKYL
ncbi:MAG: serine dehydrogenasease [Bacteroidales bacterium]|nr:serine dehydrogenasease [Bacteroidales bacterium]